MSSRNDIYGGKDPRDVAIYTVPAAAGLVGVPESTLRSWVFGRSYSVAEGQRQARAVIQAPKPGFLSFTNLVEAHVLAAMRREYRLKLDTVRRAVVYVKRELGVEHPLAREEFKTDGVELFVERLGRLVSASGGGQLAMRAAIDCRLERVEYRERRALRLFPLQRQDQPKVVVIDPRLAFGQPVLVGTGIPTAVIHERFHAGESISHLANDYGIRIELIEEALRAA
jgi:uncharacterized protein (DUF433 family)